MITSISRQLFPVNIPTYEGEIKMLPFCLDTLNEIPAKFKSVVSAMISVLPTRIGTAYLTVDGKTIKPGESHRRGGVHIDGNYLPQGKWGNGGGGNGWKVGEGGRKLNSIEHKLSYLSETGGMLIVSTYPACKGWNGIFEGQPNEGGDCSHLNLSNGGFTLQPNTVYYGNSQFLHESVPVSESVHRTLIRITLPMDYPVLNQ